MKQFSSLLNLAKFLIGFKIIKITIRLAITALLLYILFNNIEIGQLINTFNLFDLKYFIIALFVNFFRNIFASLRLHTLLQGIPNNVKASSIFNDYIIGFFLGFLLPTGLAGDIYRGNQLVNNNINVLSATSILVFERILGTVVLFFIPLMGIVLAPHLYTSIYFEYFIYLCLTFVSLCIIFIYSLKFRIIIKSFRATSELYLFKIFNKAYNEFDKLNLNYILLWKGLMLSLCYQICGILAVYLTALSINIRIPVSELMVIMPFIWLISMFPFTINGFGVREQGFVLLFNEVHLSSEKAISISFLFTLQMIIQATIGGILFLLLNNKVKVSKTI